MHTIIFRIPKAYCYMLLVFCLYLVLVVPNLESWRYAFIGDEYNTYWTAKQYIDNNGIDNIFSQHGISGNHPALHSHYHSLIMRIFGADHFGWKMAGVVSVILSGIGVYYLGKIIKDHILATCSLAFFIFSHYVFGMINYGYGHIDVLFIIIWSVVFYYWD